MAAHTRALPRTYSTFKSPERENHAKPTIAQTTITIQEVTIPATKHSMGRIGKGPKNRLFGLRAVMGCISARMGPGTRAADEMSAAAGRGRVPIGLRAERDGERRSWSGLRFLITLTTI